MLKPVLSGCLALLIVGAVRATSSCIISGSTERVCSASCDATALVDVRSGGALEGSYAASAASPLECRSWSFGLSNLIALLDCTKCGSLILFK